MSFWDELKRRNVFKVGAAYAIVAWLLVQIANTFFPIFNMPGWTVTLVASLLVLGLPVALILAWAYELTPDGVKLTNKVPLADSITHLTGHKLNYIVTGLLVIAVAYILFDNLYLDRRTIQTEVISTVAEQTPAAVVAVEVKESPKTIAVLPFDDLSPEKDQEYFVLGLSEEILNSLAQIEDLTVMAKTSSFSFKDTNKTIQEIADVLGVENILEGSVRKSGNSLRITAQLIRATDGAHLWSKTYDRELKDIFVVQEDIATTVTDELKATLGIGRSLKQLGSTDNEKAYEFYLVALGQDVKGDFSGALESIDTALALDPEFALAWNMKAKEYMLDSYFTQSDLEASKPLDAVKRAIEIEPNLGSAYITLGSIQSFCGDYVEAELSFRKAVELLKESLSGDDNWIITHYLSVGKFNIAREFIEQIQRNDPLHPAYAGHSIVNLGYTGDTQRAEEEYEWGEAVFGDNWWLRTCITNARIGSGSAVSHDEVVYSDPIYNAVAKEYLDSPEKGLAELRRLYANNDSTNVTIDYISLWAAYFGDPEFAIDVFEQKRGKLNIIGTGDTRFLWFPVCHDARQLPRFKEYVREMGLVDYWEQFGWPDICRPLDDGDFECD